MKQIPVFVITGPTATGKTAAALTLARKINAEIISVDSRQIYRYLNIGTGKDLPKDAPILPDRVVTVFRGDEYCVSPYSISDISVWLYDIINPDQQCSIAQFTSIARNVIEYIHRKNKPIILVGGSGYYLSAVLQDIPFMRVPVNAALREELGALSREQLQQRLVQNEPSEYEKLNTSDRNNPRRLIRKIEILQYLRLNPLRLQESSGSILCRPTTAVLWAANESLKRRIITRVDTRLQAGIMHEIAGLLTMGYTWESPGLQTISYKEWQYNLSLKTEHVLSNSDLTNIRSTWIRNEYLYAKRQMTWFRKMPHTTWISVDDPDWYGLLDGYVDAWYTNIRHDYKS